MFFYGNWGGYIPMIVKMAGDRMAELKRIGNIYDENRGTGYAGNVWDKNRLAPTLISTEGGNKQPMIGVCNTLTSVQKDNLLLEAKKINKIGQISNEGSQCGVVVSDDGLFLTITAGTHGYVNPHICTKSKEMDSERFFNQALETFVENDCEPGDTINAYNKTVDKSGLCPTLTTCPEGFKTAILPVVENNNSDKVKQITKVESRYRIRKLTPRECWRLMGFSDEDFEKAAKVNSNTQLYKEAGNSIVKDVLMAIFRQMID